MNEQQILQEKIAYQELAIEQLNDAMTEQQQQILRLQDEVRLLSQLIRQWKDEGQASGFGAASGAASASDRDEIVHEIPPHY